MGETSSSLYWQEAEDLKTLKGKKLEKRKKQIKRRIKQEKKIEREAAAAAAAEDDGWYGHGVDEEPPVDFSRWDLRVAKCDWTQPHPLSPDLHYLQQVDVGDTNYSVTVSELVQHYKDTDLMEGRDMVMLVNIRPPRVYGLLSYGGAVLCAVQGDKVELLSAPAGSKGGDKIYVAGFPRHPDKPHMKDYKRIPEKVLPDLWVNHERQVEYRGEPLRVKGLEGFITTDTLTDCGLRFV